MAVKALQAYFTAKSKMSGEGKKKLLVDEEDCYINLSFTLTQMPTRPSPKPVQVTLPHPITSAKYNSRACLFVKDPESEFKKQIEDMDVPCIAEVIGFDRLKRDFR